MVQILNVNCESKNLSSIRKFLGTAIKDQISQQIKKDIVLASDEFIQNLVKYTFDLDDEKKLQIKVVIRSELIEVKFYFNGKKFIKKYLDIKIDPAKGKTIEEKSFGGRGNYIINKLIDKIEILNDNDWVNCVLFKKFITS